MLRRDQFKAYFQNYTSGSAKVVAEACGERKALDAWRQLADRGHSGRPLHVNKLRVKANSPKTLIPAKAREAAIALWKMDVQLYTHASGDEFIETNRRIFFERMCPEKLQDHLDAQGPRFATYDDVRLEISDWLARENARNKGGAKTIGAVEAPAAPAQAAEEE